jgi:hypothetical protein
MTTTTTARPLERDLDFGFFYAFLARQKEKKKKRTKRSQSVKTMPLACLHRSLAVRSSNLSPMTNLFPSQSSPRRVFRN